MWVWKMMLRQCLKLGRFQDMWWHPYLHHMSLFSPRNQAHLVQYTPSLLSPGTQMTARKMSRCSIYIKHQNKGVYYVLTFYTFITSAAWYIHRYIHDDIFIYIKWTCSHKSCSLRQYILHDLTLKCISILNHIIWE